MNSWKKNIGMWKIKDTLYMSIVFTWDLEKAKNFASVHKGRVMAGGPAVSLMPDYLKGIAKIGYKCDFDVLSLQNPFATFTTRGCPHKCPFCAVPKTEGDFVELKAWKINPLICDNNIFASSMTHFNKVIDSVKHLPHIDFQSGTEAELFTVEHARKLQECKSVKLRFAFDHISKESRVVDAVKLAKEHGLKDISCYCLIGFDDTPEDAIYRLELLRSIDVMPNPMRFQPLYAKEKNEYIHPNWTELELKRVMRYYSKLVHLGHINYSDYNAEDFDIKPTEQLVLI